MNDHAMKAAEYGAKAIKYAKDNPGTFPTISPGSPEWSAWVRYFEHLGFEPWALKRARHDETKPMTVPTQWPEWFDPSFTSVPKLTVLDGGRELIEGPKA